MLSQIPSVNYLLPICNLFSDDFGWYNEHFENGRSSRLYRTVRLEEAEAIEVIGVLQEHENKNLYTAAFDIIDTWFNDQSAISRRKCVTRSSRLIPVIFLCLLKPHFIIIEKCIQQYHQFW